MVLDEAVDWRSGTPKAERKPFEPLLVGRRLYGPNRSGCCLNPTILGCELVDTGFGPLRTPPMRATSPPQ